jgi:hypothetical protein
MNFSGVPDNAEWNGWDIDPDYDPEQIARNDCDQGSNPQGRDTEDYRIYFASLHAKRPDEGRNGGQD